MQSLGVLARLRLQDPNDRDTTRTIPMKSLHSLKTIIALAIAPLLLGFLVGCSQPQSTPTPEATTPKLTAVKFHKDTCGTCKKIDAFLPDLKQEFSNRPVEFVEFDFTDESATAATQSLAKQKGLDGLLAEHSGSGYILLVDENGKPVKKLSGKEYDQAGMTREINAATN